MNRRESVKVIAAATVGLILGFFYGRLTASNSQIESDETMSPAANTPHVTKEHADATTAPSSTAIIIPTSADTPQPIIMPTPADQSWPIQVVDSMKETKDRVENQRDDDFVNKWMDAASELGVTHVAIDTPLDNPKGEDSIDYTRRWLNAARKRSLLVFHRHMPLTAEGIYDRKKNPDVDYLKMVEDYVIQHPDFFREGDIFSVPEIQNWGIKGGTYCPQDVCIFDSRESYNTFIRDLASVAETAFAGIDLKDKVKVWGHGFDGFVTAGLDNPDWEGKSFIEPATMLAMDNVLSLDHYPNPSAKMETDLEIIRNVWPQALLFISEWGTIHGESVSEMRKVLEIFQRYPVIGINYWHMGMGGQEALLEDDFSKTDRFEELKAWFHGQRG